MFEEINQRLGEVKEGMKAKNKLSSRMERTEDSLHREREKLRQLQEQLDKEDLDVQKLEKGRFSAFLYSLTGKLQSKLEKEREELALAALTYEECRRTVESLEKELKELQSELRRYTGVEQEYRKLMEEKEKKILELGDEQSRQYAEWMEKKADLQVDMKELQEACSAGNQVASALKQVLRCLEKAEDWGTWDMLGGGMLASSAKHSELDDAADYAQEAQKLLRSFHHELLDVGLESQLEIEMGGFSRFADIFMDGFLFDWMVQSRIEDSIDRVEQVDRQIHRLLQSLDGRVSECSRQMELTQQDMMRLLEQA